MTFLTPPRCILLAMLVLGSDNRDTKDRDSKLLGRGRVIDNWLPCRKFLSTELPNTEKIFPARRTADVDKELPLRLRGRISIQITYVATTLNAKKQ